MYKRAMRFANARVNARDWEARTGPPIVTTAVSFSQRQRDRDLRMEAYLVRQIQRLSHYSAQPLRERLAALRKRMADPWSIE